MTAIFEIGVHFRENSVDHLGKGSLSCVAIDLRVRRQVDRILSLKRLHECAFMNFRIDCNRDREQSLDHFKLHLVVAVLRAVTNCLHNRIDKQSRSLSVRWRRRVPLLVFAIIRTISVQEVQAE